MLLLNLLFCLVTLFKMTVSLPFEAFDNMEHLRSHASAQSASLPKPLHRARSDAKAPAITPRTERSKLKAWLLIGVPRVMGVPYYYLPADETREEQLAAIFRRGLAGLGLDLVVKPRATQYDLFSALHDSRTVAVFWIGHSRASKDPGAIIPPGLMSDAQDVDVTQLFSQIHPNVRYLSVIGCQSQGILKYFARQGDFKTDPFLRFGSTIDTYSSLVEPSIGLVKAIQRGSVLIAKSLMREPRRLCRPEVRRYYRVKISRFIGNGGLYDQAYPVRVIFQDQIVATFPSDWPNHVQTQIVYVPIRPDVQGPHDFDIEVSTDPNVNIPDVAGFNQIGKFRFDLEGQPKVQWEPLRAPDGEILGDHLHLYKVKSVLPNPSLGVKGPC